MYETYISTIFLKLWIFTNRNTVFPVVVLVFDFNEFPEGVLVTWPLTDKLRENLPIVSDTAASFCGTLVSIFLLNQFY
jgi:hypothetical protein